MGPPIAPSKNRIRTNVVVGRTRVEEGRVRQMAEDHVLRERVIEHAEAGADDSLAFSGDVPRGADARGKVLLVRVVQTAQSGLTDLRQGEGSVAASRLVMLLRRLFFSRTTPK